MKVSFFGVTMGFLGGVLIAALTVPAAIDGGGGVGASTDPRREGDSSGFGVTGAATPAEVAAGQQSGAPEATGSRGQARRVPAGGSTLDGAARGAVRGVTEGRIKVGVALLELGALKALGPAFDNGNRKAHFESILQSWRRSGAVPVHGRDIEFVYRSYSPLSPAEQRSACAGLAQDEKVFAVIADSQFAAGIECVAREFRTPIITSDAPDDSAFERGSPFIFTLQTSQSRMFRNLVHWADRRGALKGRKIGLYYLNDAVVTDVVNRNIKAELAKLGYSLAAEATTDQALGGPGDSVAVQRFRAADVDLAILLTSKAGFMQQADAQRYRPTYLESDYLSGTTNTATSTYPAAHFDGTMAITAMRFGEWKAGMPTPPEAAECLSAYERESGLRIEPNAREAEYIALTKACDDGRVFLQALQRVGRDLDTLSISRALEGTRNLTMAIHGPVTFTATKHHGGDLHRSLRWTADCRCWRALGEFAPFPVP